MAAPSAKAPPLLLDAMLGSLARRLRWLGYDAEYRNDLSDGELIALARREGRVLITRDRGLAHRRVWRKDGRRLYLAETELEAQVRAVMAALGPPSGPRRCIVCNGELDPLAPAEAAPLVPPYVAQTQTEFVRCRRCRRVYWPGTHLAGLEAWRP